MAERFNLISPRPRKDGKTHWHNIGSAFPRDKGGYSLVFDSLPLPDAEGRVTVLMTEPLPDNGGGQGGARGGQSNAYRVSDQAQRPPAQTNALDDEIPFLMEWRA